MARNPPNIVQCEFFAPSLPTLEGTALDVLARSADGMRAKTVVRFYDDGHVTRCVEAYQRLAETEKALLDGFPPEETRKGLFPGLRRRLASMRLDAIFADQGHARIRTLVAAKRQLALALSEGTVALEPWSMEPFRPVRRDEAHELKAAAARSDSAWFYVFPYGPLCADAPGRAIAYQT